MQRETWKSRFGFMVAASGSAVGLVNIWRFPYVVAQYGGGAFLLLYLLFLFLIGYPVLVSENLIGRTAKRGPAGALAQLSHRPAFGYVGASIVGVGFIVSSFYSVVAGWVLGYLVQALWQGFGSGWTMEEATQLFDTRLSSASWCVGYHLLFMVFSVAVLIRGVRKGLELGNKFMMPLLVVLLLFMMVRGLALPGASKGLLFLLRIDLAAMTPLAVLTALGHAFFTLSLGQGTMITYGSYLSGKEKLANICAPIVIFDTLISLLAGVAILTVVFAADAPPAQGVGLIFSTLPVVFSKIPGGAAMAVLFFFLVALAALSSQISAMEPVISHLVDQRRWRRSTAVLTVGLGAFLLGIPSALSFGVLRKFTLFGSNFFTVISSITMDLLLPLGGADCCDLCGLGLGLSPRLSSPVWQHC